jgi:HEPN domain-containing protein
MACFAAQQCAEKYLKARLQEAGVNFKKTHDLEELLKLVLPIESTWNTLLPDLKYLNGFAVDFRYPGASATKLQAKNAIKSCRNVRKVIRVSFGLPV